MSLLHLKRLLRFLANNYPTQHNTRMHTCTQPYSHTATLSGVLNCTLTRQLYSHHIHSAVLSHACTRTRCLALCHVCTVLKITRTLLLSHLPIHEYSHTHAHSLVHAVVCTLTRTLRPDVYSYTLTCAVAYSTCTYLHLEPFTLAHFCLHLCRLTRLLHIPRKD